MNRRHFFKFTGLSAGLLLLQRSKVRSQDKVSIKKSDLTGKIMTVTGPIEPKEMGFTLTHEHVFSIFGKDPVRYPFYQEDALFESVLPYLEKVKSLGCQTIVDATAAYFGRHPEYLKKFSGQSGLHILTNTGYYAAAKDRYVPPFAYTETVDQLTERWVREWQYSIDGTGVYPGFIKTGIDNGPLSDIDAKLMRVAARTHKQTGLSIQTHARDNFDAINNIFDIFAEEKVDPSAWIWVHAHHVKTADEVIIAAQKGAWISIDGIKEERAEHVIEIMKEMKNKNLLNKILLSHDGNSYRRDGSRGPYHYILTDFIPLLIKNGFNENEIKQLTVTNPANAFTVRKRVV